MTAAAVPSTLVKCLYLFFDLPDTPDTGQLPQPTESEPEAEFTPRERRILLQKMFMQVLLICLFVDLLICFFAGPPATLCPRACSGGAGQEGRPHPPLLGHQLRLPGAQHDVEENVQRRPPNRVEAFTFSAGHLLSAQQRLHITLH